MGNSTSSNVFGNLETDGTTIGSNDYHLNYHSNFNAEGNGVVIVYELPMSYKLSKFPTYTDMMYPSGKTGGGDNLDGIGAISGNNSGINSFNGKYSLICQTDGNVVLYENNKDADRTALWNSGTAYDYNHAVGAGVIAAPFAVVLQPDGDLTFRYIIKITETWLGIDTGTVTYTPTSISISKTGGHSKEAKLAVTNSGDVVLYGACGDVLWVLDKSTSAP